MDSGLMELIQQTNCDGFLLKDCIPELQELMKHLDTVIIEKQNAWEVELQSARNEVDLRNTQLNQYKVKMEQKDLDIQGLEMKVENKTKIINQYDVELVNLRSQVKNLKLSHQEMNERRALKQKNICNREKEYQAEIDRLKVDLNQQRVIVAQHQKESSEWGIKKKSLEKQIECMERQKEAILNNYENCRHTLSEVRIQLKSTKDIKNKIDNDSRIMIQKLEDELLCCKRQIQKQDLLSASLQKRLQEMERKQLSRYRDQQAAASDNVNANSRTAMLEEENKRLSKFLSLKEDELRKNEAAVVALKNNVKTLQKELNNKHEEVVESRGKERNAKERMKYEKRITELEESLNSVRSSEASMKDQVMFLERQLDKSNECIKARYFNSFDNVKVDSLTDELKSLKEKVKIMEKSHTNQLEFMKNELNKLTKAWKQGSHDGDVLTKTCSEMEKKLGDEAQIRSRLNKELENVVRNFQSIQQEATTETREVDSSLHEVERSLWELRRGYEKADSNLNKQNSNLKNKVTNLRKIGELTMEKQQEKQTQQEQQEEMEQTITVDEYGDDGGDMSTRHLRTPTPTREFLRSIGFYSASDCDATSPRSSKNASILMNDSSNKRNHEEESSSCDCTTVSASRSNDEKSRLLRSYVQEDMERTTDMQRRIESHIEEVERAMTNVMEKYFSKSKK